MLQPLSSFFSLIEIMHYNIQQCTWKYSRSSYSSSQSISTEVLEHMSKAWKCVEEIQCYNAHMVMNLNLIIDYMKASRAVPLIPSLQPIELTKALSLPIQTMMHPIHNSRGVKIVLEYVDPSIADFIITDRCWIQEAILSFISNALRPSCGGPIKLFVTLKSSMSYKLDHHRYRRQHRNSSNRHTHRQQQQQQQQQSGQQQTKHRNQVVPFDSDDIKSDEDHRPLSGSELDDDGDDGDDDEEYAMVDGSLAKSEICIKKSTVMQNRSFLLFEIQDCCDGISDEVKDKLFQPFYDTDNNMGLGLYCVGKRIEALGGQYGVSERNDNQCGSVFWFLMPYIVRSPNHMILESTAGSTTGSDSSSTAFKDHVLVSNIFVRSPLKVLLVYGRCSSLEMMEQTLSLLGHDCHHQCSGTDGFIDTIEQATSGSPYDAVLLDLDCTESHHRIGYITALRQRETEDRDLLIRRTQLVIGACAHTDYNNISNALTAGINTVLSIPFPVDSLYEIVDAFKCASRR
jgi:signal transduction histidine kinase